MSVSYQGLKGWQEALAFANGMFFATLAFMMKTIALLLLSAVLLSACANTRNGISQDADSVGEKIQRTSAIWTE